MSQSNFQSNPPNQPIRPPLLAETQNNFGTIYLQPVYGHKRSKYQIFFDGAVIGDLTWTQGLKLKVKPGDHQIGMRFYASMSKEKIVYSDVHVDSGDDLVLAVETIANQFVLLAEPPLNGDASLYLSRRVKSFPENGIYLTRRKYTLYSNDIQFIDWKNSSFPVPLRIVYANNLSKCNIFLDRSLKNLLYSCERNADGENGAFGFLHNFKYTRYDGEVLGYIRMQKDIPNIYRADKKTLIGYIFMTQVEKNLYYNRDFGLKYAPTDQVAAVVQWVAKNMADYFPINNIPAQDEELMILAFVTYTSFFFANNEGAEFAPNS